METKQTIISGAIRFGVSWLKGVMAGTISLDPRPASPAGPGLAPTCRSQSILNPFSISGPIRMRYAN